MFTAMHKRKRLKSLASYPLLMTLILQLGFSSLLCAVAGYQAGASTLTICTSFGIKTISFDENGEPIELPAQHSAFDSSCFHCASGGCGTVGLLSAKSDSVFQTTELKRIEAFQIALRDKSSKTPPSRAPPHIA